LYLFDITEKLDLSFLISNSLFLPIFISLRMSHSFISLIRIPHRKSWKYSLWNVFALQTGLNLRIAFASANNAEALSG